MSKRLNLGFHVYIFLLIVLVGVICFKSLGYANQKLVADKPSDDVKISYSKSLSSRSGFNQTELGSENVKPYKVMVAEVTAYTLGEESTGKKPTDKTYGLTASGKRVKETDKVIAAPSNIMFGTKIEVDGYGKYPVLDRGGDIVVKENGVIRLDLLMETKEQALAWGRRTVKVKVYE